MTQANETMTPRERVRRTLNFETPDRVPRNLWFLPGVAEFRKTELDDLLSRWPDDFRGAPMVYGQGDKQKGGPGKVGSYVDAWGCVWSASEPGVIGEVTTPAIPDWSELDSFQPPWEIIKTADTSGINEFVAGIEKFTIAGSEVYPFERLQFLRGTENLLLDLAYGSSELFKLLDMMHEFYLEDLKMWAATDIDSVIMRDDWGSQQALLISPKMWREIFKPRYAEYCKILRDAGKYVFFHSDGNIEAIYPDFIEMGVHALNSQLFCMDIEGLAEKYKGKITFWGEIDRQSALPFGKPDDVRKAVNRVVNALYDPAGGVIAQCEWGNKDPMENIETVYSEWDKLTSK
jgi:hypothetical protein